VYSTIWICRGAGSRADGRCASHRVRYLLSARSCLCDPEKFKGCSALTGAVLVWGKDVRERNRRAVGMRPLHADEYERREMCASLRWGFVSLERRLVSAVMPCSSVLASGACVRFPWKQRADGPGMIGLDCVFVDISPTGTIHGWNAQRSV